MDPLEYILNKVFDAANNVLKVSVSADAALGATDDPAASSTVAEDTTARTGIGLWKGIKNILILLLAELKLKADQTETQPVSAASLPLPAGAATSAAQATMESDVEAVATAVAAVETELALKADLTETQPVSLASVPDVDPVTSTPAVYNKTLTSADTEYSQAMPTNCRGFEFQCRTENDVRFAFVTGKVAGPTAPYMTLKAGDFYNTQPINQADSPSTLYLASPTAGVVVEIIAWT